MPSPKVFTIINKSCLWTWAVIYVCTTGLYSASTWYNRNQFYLTARMPRLLIIDLLLITFVTCSFGERGH
jgi:hypothetical protein